MTHSQINPRTFDDHSRASRAIADRIGADRIGADQKDVQRSDRLPRPPRDAAKVGRP